jgi:hypothetical protein
MYWKAEKAKGFAAGIFLPGVWEREQYDLKRG